MNSGIYANNPYVGPRSLQRGEKIYGRQRETIELVDLIIAERIVLLYSPSGAGKTSLVQAALIPALEAERFHVLPPMRVSMDVAQRDVSLGGTNRYILSLMLSLEESRPQGQQRRLQELLTMSLEEHLRALEEDIDAQDGTILIFDQFEEILTLNPTDHEEKSAFFSELGQCLSNRGRWAIFSMREDFVAGLDPYVRFLPTQLRNTYRLGMLTPQSALEAIQEPAREATVEFDTAAAEKLINDMRIVRVQRANGKVEMIPGNHVEPVQLQVVCHRLWNTGAAEDGIIDEEDLKGVKDVSTALAGYYDERLDYIVGETGVSEERIRRWIGQKLITPQGIRSQVMQGASASDGLDNTVVEALMNAYLLRAEKRRGVTWLELAHDRLVDPIVDSNAKWNLENQSNLQRQAALWAERDEDPSLLITDGDALAAASTWARENEGILSDAEKKFLADSRTVYDKNSRQERRRLAWIAIATTLLAIVAAIGYVFAATQRQAANENERAAIAARGTAEAEATRAFDAAAAEAAAAATASAARLVEADARATAESASQAAQEANASLAEALAAAEKSAAEARQAEQEERQLRLALAAAKQEAEAQADAAEANFSQLLAAQAINRSTVELDLSLLLAVEAYKQADTPLAREAILATLQNSVLATIQVERALDDRSSNYATAFSPDGSLVAAVGFGPQPVIWEVAGGTELLRLPVVDGITAPFREIVFNGAGTRLITASQDGVIAVWNTRTGGLIRRFTYSIDNFLAMAISPDGRFLATGGDSTSVSLWDIDLGEVGRISTNHATIYSLAFSADGQFLVTAGAPRRGGSERVALWNVDSGQQVDTSVVQQAPDPSQEAADDEAEEAASVTPFTPFTGHQADVHQAIFTPDGTSLITSDDRGVIIVWNVATGREVGRFTGAHNGRVRALAVSPTGRTLVSGGVDGQVVLWDLTSGEQLGQGIRAHSAEVTSLAFGPEGTRLASTSFDLNTNHLLWSAVASRQVVGSTFAGYGGPVNAAAFSGDDGLLAVSACTDPDCRASRLRLVDTATLSGTTSIDFAGVGPSQVSLLAGAELMAARVATSTLQLFSSGVPTPTQVYTTPAGVSLDWARLVAGPEAPRLLLLVDGRPYVADLTALPPDFTALVNTARPLAGSDLAGLVAAPNGTTLLGYGDGIILYDLETDSATTWGQGSGVNAAAFSRNGARFAIGWQDRRVTIWQTSQLGEADAIPLLEASAVHSAPLNGIGFVDGDNMLVTSDSGGTIYVWSLESGQPLASPLAGHRSGVNGIALRHDGTRFVSFSNDQTLILWSASASAWSTQACRTAGRNMSQEEWTTFFGSDTTYQLTCEEWPSG